MKDYSFHMPASKEKGILLIHGLTGSPSEMRFVGKRLHKAGFTCDGPVLAGHCQDMAALLKTRYEDWIDSIHKAIERFGNEVDEVYIAGICVGGQLGLLAAHQMPGAVKGVAIYSPTLVYDGWNMPRWQVALQGLIPLATRLPFVGRIGIPEEHPFGFKSDRIRTAIANNSGDGIEGTLPVFPLKGLRENYRLNKALEKALPQIKIPTLLVHAREDDVSSPRNAEKIKALHGGNCEIAWLEDSYHMVHVDQERQKTADLTAAFFGLPKDAPAMVDEAGAA